MNATPLSKDIASKSDRTVSGWEIVIGHGCDTVEEMQAYCDQFNGRIGRFGLLLKLVDLPFEQEWK